MHRPEFDHTEAGAPLAQTQLPKQNRPPPLQEDRKRHPWKHDGQDDQPDDRTQKVYKSFGDEEQPTDAQFVHEGAQQPVRLKVADRHATEHLLIGHRHARDLYPALLGIQQGLEHGPIHGSQDGDNDIRYSLLLDQIQQARVVSEHRHTLDLGALLRRVIVDHACDEKG